ncbi:pannexin-2 isoform X1 [Notothenia coriiceps]|uniref:Pannexin-2 isoform X1 n=1 Tax=Notothenia coriiceps TaxID=8208 RepID=A0A6I9N7D6_9TELE|nr:PREDICTED: pannexin-2 isoform X1 [Notothenia coriiceps]
MQNILDQNLDMATALLAGEKLKELILPGSSQDERGGLLAGLLVQLKLELPFDRVVTIGTVIIPILLVTLVFTRNFADFFSFLSYFSEESIYCYTPHNFTRDQALYARGYCWTELRDAKPGLESHLWPSLFEHKFLPYALLAFAGIMYIPALGWEFLASTRLTSELNFLLQEIDNCYHRAAEGRAPKIEKQIQSKGPGITERERREIIENAEKEKSPEQNLFEKYLERRGESNFLAKLYLGRHLAIICLSTIPISYLSAYYARQRQNEFTCALGEPPDISSYFELKLRVNCKLPAVQLQRIMAAVDISLLCTMNLIILLNLLHLFVVRKSNFVFDKLHKVGIKTRRRWQKSQFCDINILAMFCNENRDHIKSLNRLDFITNESDLMYDNVVRQLLAALAQSNHDATPTVRDSGIQTIDGNMDPSELGMGDMTGEPLVLKRPRKKMKWIPSSNPLPQPFKEPLTLTRLENSNKPEKPKPVRRKTAADSFIAPLLDTKSTQYPITKDMSMMEKKHPRNFSLDVHPYMLTIRKPKVDVATAEPLPPVLNLDTVYLEGTHTIVHVSGSITETKICSPKSTNTAFSTMTLPTNSYVNGVSPNPPSSEDPLSPKSSPTPVLLPPPTPPREPPPQAENPECPPPALTRAPTHQLMSIHHTLFEGEEDEEQRRDRLAERPGELIAAGEC